MPLNLKPEPYWGRLCAGLGAVVWLLLFALRLGDSPETSLIQRIVLLGILVIVPLGLSLVPAEDSREREAWLYQVALLTQPLGALAAVASFLISPGPLAAALACLWFCVTVLIALWGLSRLRVPQRRASAEVSLSAGLLYLPVGSGWLIVSRLGIQVFGYGDTIVLLTAVHFHFAAFAAPILAGLAGRKLSEHAGLNRVFKLAPIGIIAGTPLVAAGITFSPATALLGTVLVSLGLFLLAILVLGWIVPGIKSFLAQVLLIVSSLSSITAMLLACLYAYSIVANKLLIDIPQMAMTHGIVNAFGFALCGLTAWAIINSSNSRRN